MPKETLHRFKEELHTIDIYKPSQQKLIESYISLANGALNEINKIISNSDIEILREHFKDTKLGGEYINNTVAISEIFN
jgi:hypothetical protein